MHGFPKRSFHLREQGFSKGSLHTLMGSHLSLWLCCDHGFHLFMYLFSFSYVDINTDGQNDPALLQS